MDEALVVIRVLVSLAAVLGLMLWLGRRLQKGQSTRDNPLAGLMPAKLAERFAPTGGARPRSRPQAAEKIKVVARAGLGGRAQLVVAEFSGIRYVLGVTERGINLVDTVEVPDDAASEVDERETAERSVRFEEVVAGVKL